MAINCSCTDIKVYRVFGDLFEMKPTAFFSSSIFCLPYTIVSDADKAFSVRRLDGAKLTFLCFKICCILSS